MNPFSRRFLLVSVASALLLFFFSAPASAQPPSFVPVNAERILDFPGERGANSPVVASSSVGSVVAWTDIRFNSEGGGVSENIWFQRIDGDGGLVGSPVQVNQAGAGVERFHPRVAMDAAGGFVVIFSKGPFGGSNISYRIYDPQGVPRTPVLQVNSTPFPHRPAGADVAMSPDGSFVVAWQRVPAYPLVEIRMQRFNPDGSFRGGEVLLDSGRDYRGGPEVALDDAGNLLVALDERTSSLAGTVLLVWLFDPDDQPILAGVELASDLLFSSSSLYPKAVTRGTGDFVAAWHGLQGIQLRTVDVTGAIGPPTVLDPDGPRQGFSLFADDTGTLYVLRSGQVAGEVDCQPFRVNGSLLGEPATVASDPDLWGLSLSLTPGGEAMVVAWQTDPSGCFCEDGTFSRVRVFGNACLSGVVDASSGPVANLLLVNGSYGGLVRKVEVATGEPVNIELLSAPAGPDGTYLLYAWLGEPTRSCSPLGSRTNSAGLMANPTPLRPDRLPQPFRCLVGPGIPARACGAVGSTPGPASTPWTISHPGLRHPLVVTLQAAVRDAAALNPALGFSVTNAVTLRIVEE